MFPKTLSLLFLKQRLIIRYRLKLNSENKTMKQGFLFMAMMTSIGFLHAADQYPKALSVSDAIQYFAQHPKITMKKPGEGFDFMIKGNDIERYCSTCGTDTGYGNIKYRNHSYFLYYYNIEFHFQHCYMFRLSAMYL